MQKESKSETLPEDQAIKSNNAQAFEKRKERVSPRSIFAKRSELFQREGKKRFLSNSRLPKQLRIEKTILFVT